MNWIDEFGKEAVKFSCIRASLNEVQKLLAIIVNDSFGKRWILEEDKAIDLDYLTAFVNESHLKKIKYLLWQPYKDKSYTVFLSNMPDGWITLMTNFTLKSNHEVFMASFSKPTREYPLYRFYYQSGRKKRVVQVMKDTDKWHFYTEGELLEIEEQSFYNKRRIIDRFNNDLLEKYMESFGFACSSESFWQSNAAVEHTFKIGAVSR